MSSSGLRDAAVGFSVAPSEELRFAETSELGDRRGRTSTDAAARQDAFLEDQLVRQRRLATAAKHDALAELPAVIGEEIKLDLVEPGIEQLAHPTFAEDLVDRADQDEDAAGDEQIDRLSKEAGLLPSSTAELVIERRIEVHERERVPRDAGRLEAARAEQPHVGVSLRDPGSPAGVQLDREDVAP